jgi:hypothetical protein
MGSLTYIEGVDNWVQKTHYSSFGARVVLACRSYTKTALSREVSLEVFKKRKLYEEINFGSFGSLPTKTVASPDIATDYLATI